MQASTRPTDRHLVARRVALLLAMLISGGLLLFPRVPLLLVMIVLCLAATGWRLPRTREFWPAYLLLAGVLVVTLVRPGPVSMSSLAARFATFAGALLLLNAYLRAPQGALARDLNAILFWMAIQAIATVVLAHTVGFLFVTLPQENATYQTLLLLFNYHVTIEDAGGLLRPDGLFWEPGVFQIYLNLYLFLQLFVLHRPRAALLGVIAVAATQSTTGLLICALLLAAALSRRLGSGRLGGRMAALVVAAVLVPSVGYLTYQNVNEKLSGTYQGSSWAREYDFYTGLNVIAANPWLGIGFDVKRYTSAASALGYEESMLSEESTDERGTTNGLIQLFYALGVPLALPFFIGLFRQKLFPHRGLVGAWLALSMFGEALLFTPFFLMFIFSAFTSSRPRSRRKAVVPALVS